MDIWIQGISQDCTLANANGQLSISTDQPTTVAYQNTVGPGPPTRDTPGSSAGGIVRLPNSVSQLHLLFSMVPRY